MTKVHQWVKVIQAALTSRSNQAFYDRISPFYDELFVSHRVHAEKIVKILANHYGDRQQDTAILDLGCGTGLLSAMLAEKGYQVIGVDISFSSLCVLRQRKLEIETIQAAANALPVADESFDVVVCLGVWRHFPDQQKVLAEIHRILRHKGVFIVGYFPPNLAGAIPVPSNYPGRWLIRLYQALTRRFGYQDLVDVSLGTETAEAAMKYFKTVTEVASEKKKYLIVASR